MPAGEFAIVLHTHMPYVEGGGEWPPSDMTPVLRIPEGFGTWPFGEEWLWEAIATSYVPLLDVLDAAARQHGSGRAPVTLSLTPVLCDQLEAPGAIERCRRFLREVRPASHALDLEEYAGQPRLVAELERSAAEYAATEERLCELGDAGLLAGLGAHATWTSSATHAVLPLLCTEAGLELQAQLGVAAHRHRFGAWAGGFWLPECAHAPWLHPPLEAAGARAACVELTGCFGLGDPRHLRPLQTDDGPILWPLDRAVIDLVWGDGGFPSRAAYRAYESRTPRDHRLWSNDGQPYDAERAAAQLRADAREFIATVAARLAGGGVCVCAFDTELFGHWWYEGVGWLAAVIQEAAAQGVELVGLDDALEASDPAPAPEELPVTSWGRGGDLRTWSSPKVASFAWRARTAELRAFAAPALGQRALRELLALQASDWAFLADREWAGDYPAQRTNAHLAAFECALEDASAPAALRNLAPFLGEGPQRPL